jgi:urease accessory protein
VTATPVSTHQRSHGEIVLGVEAKGLSRMREAGASKVRFPQGGSEAILINTGGGLVGGDCFRFDITAGADSTLTLTTQAAERVYRSLGSPASIDVALKAEAGARLHWLPQESIMFDGAALSRRIDADVAADARLLAVESVILGRAAMGETVAEASLRDRWRIRREGRLIFADDLAFTGAPPLSKATLGDARAFATVVLVSPDAEELFDPVRAMLDENSAASAWSGKLVARLRARDGFELRKVLIPVLSRIAEPSSLPKVWSL